MPDNSVATIDCRTCRTRRIKCDRHVPACAKCTGRKYECPGYGPRLKWIEGVASRGKLKGSPSPASPIKRRGIEPTSLEKSRKGIDEIEAPLFPQSFPPQNSRFGTRASIQDSEVISRVNILTTPMPSGFQHRTIRELLFHYDQTIASQLAWVDTLENPWRKVILPLAVTSPILLSSILALTSADLSQRFRHSNDVSTSDKLGALSDMLREKAVLLLTYQLKDERQAKEDPLRMPDTKSSNLILASMLVLCNLELKRPESAVWRVHLNAARTIIRGWDNTTHLPCPSDPTSIFLLHEFFTTHVWDSITIFGKRDDLIHDTLISDNETMFMEHCRIIQDITELIRIRIEGSQAGLPHCPVDIVALENRFELAKQRTLTLSRGLKFSSDQARREFEHLVGIFHQSGLIYGYRIPYNDTFSPNLESHVKEAKNKLFNHFFALTEITLFAQDLVWPLFIAGTESCNSKEAQVWVEMKMQEVMRTSGLMDRQRVLHFLKSYWVLCEEGFVNWVEVARDWANKGNSFLVY